MRNNPFQSADAANRNAIDKLEGFEKRIMVRMMAFYNFTWDIEELQNISKDMKSVDNLVTKTFSDGKFDVAIGRLPYPLIIAEDFSCSYTYDDLAFFVPCGSEEQSLGWLHIHVSLLRLVCIVLLIFFLSIILTVIKSVLPQENPIFMSFSTNALTVFGIHIECVVSLKIVTNTMRFLLVVIMFYCMVMSVAYKASLKSLLMAPLKPNTIQTWEELEKSNLKIAGSRLGFSVLKEISEDHFTLQEILKRFQIKTYSELTTLLNSIKEGHDTAYFGLEEGLSLMVLMSRKKNLSAEPSLCQVNGAVVSSPLSLSVTRRGSPLTLLINHAIIKNMQAGLLKHNMSVPVKRTTSNRITSDPKSYTLKQFRYIFLLWLTGMIIASFLFLLEALNFFDIL
ncbi:hypothetical protein J6590_033056 [Homalodisca vitripennis]|nr:hypothetical protein J6590_033056 [Homalodisca vitripennis]